MGASRHFDPIASSKLESRPPLEYIATDLSLASRRPTERCKIALYSSTNSSSVFPSSSLPLFGKSIRQYWRVRGSPFCPNRFSNNHPGGSADIFLKQVVGPGTPKKVQTWLMPCKSTCLSIKPEASRALISDANNSTSPC